MSELERMMTAQRRYRRKRGGAWRQVSGEAPPVTADGMPAWCSGCAWSNLMLRGACEVFVSCLECWREEGECAAWADAEGRERIEREMVQYAEAYYQRHPDERPTA